MHPIKIAVTLIFTLLSSGFLSSAYWIGNDSQLGGD